MNDETAAAVERLRRIKGDIQRVGYCYFASVYPNGGHLEDLQLLSDLYLAEHPADSELPVTEEWAEKFLPGNRDGRRRGKRGRVWFEKWSFCSTIYVNGEIVWDSRRPDKDFTRGLAMRLCSALGIELKEPSHE